MICTQTYRIGAYERVLGKIPGNMATSFVVRSH